MSAQLDLLLAEFDLLDGSMSKIFVREVYQLLAVRSTGQTYVWPACDMLTTATELQRTPQLMWVVPYVLKEFGEDMSLLDEAEKYLRDHSDKRY